MCRSGSVERRAHLGDELEREHMDDRARSSFWDRGLDVGHRALAVFDTQPRALERLLRWLR
jgi:hypothetical protein